MSKLSSRVVATYNQPFQDSIRYHQHHRDNFNTVKMVRQILKELCSRIIQ